MPNISNSDYLAIAGIMITVIIGLWPIYLTLRRAKYPASFTFVREESVALLDDFAKKIPNLTVLYKDTPVNKDVVLLSGYLVNDGSVDITQEMTEQPLSCTLPSGCSWLEFKVTTTAKELHVEGKIVEDDKVELLFGLFRRDESFSFQALVLIGENHKKKKVSEFANELCWAHRIASLGKIKTIQMPQVQYRGKIRYWLSVALAIAMCLFYIYLGSLSLVGIGEYGSTPKINFQIEVDGKRSDVKLQPNRDGTTTLLNMSTGETKVVTLSTYVKTAKFIPIYSVEKESRLIKMLLGLFFIVTGVMFFYTSISKDYKRYKLRKLVAASAGEA